MRWSFSPSSVHLFYIDTRQNGLWGDPPQVAALKKELAAKIRVEDTLLAEMHAGSEKKESPAMTASRPRTIVPPQQESAVATACSFGAGRSFCALADNNGATVQRLRERIGLCVRLDPLRLGAATRGASAQIRSAGARGERPPWACSGEGSNSAQQGPCRARIPAAQSS